MATLSCRAARGTFLPFSVPQIGEEEIAEVVDSLRSGWLTTGPKVQAFERDFAAYVDAPHAIAVSSCTAGLLIALKAAGAGPGGEVIVPTLTFCATANVVVELGARPVIVDVDERGLMTERTVARALTPRTRAIVPVHYAGQPCDLDPILALAGRRGIDVIEDAAHAAGTEYHGRRIGVHGRAAVFSFYATKNMTTGEGGMITTADDALAARMRVLALHGMNRDAWQRYTGAGSWFYEVVEPGFKCNMTDVQAALGIHQLRRLDGFIARRRAIAAAYDTAFDGVPELLLPPRSRAGSHTFHLYPVCLASGRLSIGRGRFIAELKARNIGASVHFIPLHRHPYYRDRCGCRAEDYPAAESLYESLLSLPLYPAMSDRDVEDVIDAVTDVVEANRR